MSRRGVETGSASDWLGARWWAWLATLLIASVVALSTGCGPAYGEAFLRPFRAAQRANSAGRHEEAARLFAEASREARRVKDRDEATFMEARMYEKLGRWEDAQATYERLVKVSPKGPRSGRSVYEAALLEIDHGDEARGYAMLARAIETYPNHGTARRALSMWAVHTGQTKGETQTRAMLRRWQKQLAGTETEQPAKYEIARSLRRSGLLREAHAQFLVTAREHPYPIGSLTDDAFWRASFIAEELGDAKLAVADLDELLSAREVADGGSYERPRYPMAQMRLGELYRDRLGDYERARAAFRLVHRRHKKSILADDAMWQEGLLHNKLGDVDAACDVAEDFPERFPTSRYLRCLMRICPAAPPAKRACPSYIIRQIDEPPTQPENPVAI